MMRDLKEMEIGEVLPFGFKLIKCIEPYDTDNQCAGCDLASLCKQTTVLPYIVGSCNGYHRKDKTSVIFKVFS